MSEEFQDRLEENEEEIKEELELDEEDTKFIWDNITEFCEESDKQVLEDIVYVEEEEPEEDLVEEEPEKSADEDKDILVEEEEKEKEIKYVKEDESISKKKKKKRDSQKASEIVCTMSHEEFMAMTKKVIKKVFIKLNSFGEKDGLFFC